MIVRLLKYGGDEIEWVVLVGVGDGFVVWWVGLDLRGWM